MAYRAQTSHCRNNPQWKDSNLIFASEFETNKYAERCADLDPRIADYRIKATDDRITHQLNAKGVPVAVPWSLETIHG